MAITPAFLTDLETRMRVIQSNAYDSLNANQWWRSIVKLLPGSQTKKERVVWLLDTAQIQRTGKGGNIEFEDICSATTEYEFLNAGDGLKIKQEHLEDLDANGVQAAAHWSRQMGELAAYWPQQCLAEAILANDFTYDGKRFFATDHPYNLYNVGAGSFANLFTGAADANTGYPGAVPIDGVSIEQAVENISKVISYAAAIKMPNGKAPRNLRLAQILVPAALMTRAVQITNAKYIVQSGINGVGGSADIEAVIRNFGLGQPIQATELGAAYGGSDRDYYLAMQQVTSDELGAFGYAERKPFETLYYGPQNDAQLARIREFQWMMEGRNNMINGHPYLLFKCRAT